MTEPVISFSHVTKRYQIVQRATPRMGAWVVNKLFEHLRRQPFEALSDVSFEVPKGQMVGILGTNGAGKSTVLKLIAGITLPTSGTIGVRGRIASMLELGVGFHPDLTGMENIFYSGQIMGLSRQQVLERLPRIIEFSGMEKFLYEVVRHYSSGMYARLAMSVALHVDPDIILMDEILAVGDAEFQRKGMLKVLELNERGATIILVTHVMAAARDICHRLIWLDHGRVREDGSARDVLQKYGRYASELSVPEGHFLSPGAPMAGGDESPRIAGVTIKCHGVPASVVNFGDDVAIEIETDDRAARTPYRVAVTVRWIDGRVLFEDVSGPMEPGTVSPIVYDVPNWPFLRAKMLLDVGLVAASGEPLVFDRRIAVPFETMADDDYAITDVVMAPRAKWENVPV